MTFNDGLKMMKKISSKVASTAAVCATITASAAVEAPATPNLKAQMGLMAPTGRPVETYSWRSDRGGEVHNMVVVKPAKPVEAGKKAPLFVVLHGHGASIVGCYRWEAMPIDAPHKCDICWIPEDFYGVVLEVRRIEDWWGIPKDSVSPKGKDAQRKPVPKKISETEKRVLEQVEWMASNFDIDRNRIYLGGASMGGSGTLGLGLPNGDVFAAIKANVSASPYHSAKRMGFGEDEPARVPDPPVLVEYSAQDDRWSMDKDILYTGMDDAKYAYYAYWGAFGHSGKNVNVLRKNDLVGSFNIFDITLDQPYVAFSKGTSNDPMPWPEAYLKRSKHPLGLATGQRNAYFRWKNIEDTPEKFEVELRLLTSNEWKSAHFTFPKAASADVTPRRIANFDIKGGEKIACTYNGKNFEVVADKTGHVTIPQLEMTIEPRTLTLKHIEPRKGKKVKALKKIVRKPGEANKGLTLGEYAGEFISVDGMQKPGEVPEIAAVLREPFKRTSENDDKSNCPLVIVHKDDGYSASRIDGGEALVPEGSWALFLSGGNTEKEVKKNQAWIDCAIDFAKKVTGAKQVKVLDYETPPKK